MAARVDGISQIDIGLSSAPGRAGGGQVRMVVGITSAQTCLVLRKRLLALREAGFVVTLVASPGELLLETAKQEGVSAIAIEIHRDISLPADLRSFFALLMLLWRVRPTITDFSTPKAGLLGNLAAWLLRVPHRVYTLRGLRLESAVGWKRLLLLWSERVAAACAHVVLCNSESLRSKAMVLRIAPAGKLRLLGDGSSNGVDVRRFSPGRSGVRAELGIASGEVVVGFTGRLTKDKGVPELLEAFEAILLEEPNCQLLLVGWPDSSQDALEPRSRRQIEEHARIHCTGFVSDVVPYYRAMDLLILPTHREGFPNVVLEAGACGLPVITTEATGSRDSVVAEVTGLLIPPGLSEPIVQAALRLIRDAGERERMGAAARRWVVERYSSERVLGLAVEFYREMVLKRSS